MPSLQILTLSRNKILSFQLPTKKLFHTSRSHYRELPPKASAVPEVWAGCLTWQWKETFKVSSLSVLKAFQWRRLFKEKTFWQGTYTRRFFTSCTKDLFLCFLSLHSLWTLETNVSIHQKEDISRCYMQGFYRVFIPHFCLPNAA